MLLKTKRKYIKPEIVIEELCDEVIMLPESQEIETKEDPIVKDPTSEGEGRGAKSGYHVEFDFYEIDE